MHEKRENMKNGKDTASLISETEKSLAVGCMEAALRHGARQVRVSLNKSVMDTCSMLNGKLDKVAHSADRSVFLYIFADDRYGTFSTNMLDRDELERFAAQAVDSVKILAKDPFRRLPGKERTEKNALTGTELGLYDENYNIMSSRKRVDIAENECIYGKGGCVCGESRLISEECEYSDSVDDNFTADSDGFAGRHTETSFGICSEMTVEGKDGRKYSGYWWDSSPFLDGLRRGYCSETALTKALAQTGPERHKGGAFNMVVDSSVSSRLISPVISALNSASIQQESSFLKESLGEKMFSEGLSLIDAARTPGKPGSRLFDTEGVATKDMDVIRDGCVKTYFTNTYMSLKMGIPPTIEGISRPVLLPFGNDNGQQVFGAAEIMHECGTGIYVTGFNGGNCNPTTGNFSYGIEGFAFRNGKITHPVREMVITGNMLTLWSRLIHAGNDARACTRWQIPSLSFEKVDFSG